MASARLLVDLLGPQIVDHVGDLLLVERSPSVGPPGGHGRVGSAVDDPVPDLVVCVAEENVVEGRSRPVDVDPAPLLHVAGAATTPIGPVTVGAADRGHHLGAPFERLLVELLDEAGLPVLLAQVVDGEIEGEETGENHGGGLHLLQPLALQLVVGLAGRHVARHPFAAPVADAGRYEEGEPAHHEHSHHRDDDGGGQQTSIRMAPTTPPRGLPR